MMRFFLTLASTNLRASFALRGAFLLQAAFMAVNNLLFFVIWWILFDRFEEIRGYRIADMAALYGIAAAGYGIAALVAGGLPDLGRKITEGELDALLTQPRSVLVQAVASRTRPDGWGDIGSGVGLLVFSGYLATPLQWPVAALGIVLAAATFVAAGVMLHSAAFFLDRVGALARQMNEFLITFSVYPPTLFGGALKILLFTVLPAGFVSYLPVEILRTFDPRIAAMAVMGTSAYACAAWWVFHRGLKVYRSGSRITARR